jgi:phage portal protein BeeE
MSGSIPGEFGAADERALRDSLRAADLSADALLRIRRATENEWRRNLERPVRRARALAASLTALALLVGVAYWSAVSQSGHGASMARRCAGRHGHPPLA